MFREIANGIRGRKKTVDEKLTYDGLSDFLLDMGSNPVREASLNYLEYDVERTIRVEDFKPITTSDAMVLIRKKLGGSPLRYTRIKHQAFSGKTETKHYIDIATGAIFCPSDRAETPYKEVSIKFVVNKEK